MFVGFIRQLSGNGSQMVNLICGQTKPIARIDYIPIGKLHFSELVTRALSAGDLNQLDKLVGLENVHTQTEIKPTTTLAIKQAWGYDRFGYNQLTDAVVVQITFADGTNEQMTIALPARCKPVSQRMSIENQ
jgi:hypothetical protein